MESGGPVLAAGYRLDRYELLCPIASGGMATVWLAQLRGKRGFEKLFAIKTIKTDLTDDATFQEMFLDEARIASGIQHPNVAQILDLGEQNEVLYIVMEWVDGDSLARIVKLARKRGRPLPIGVALRVVADACAGLHAAHELRDDMGHELGVVHRDVSPHNIIVSAAGSVKVIDFGVAKARNRYAGDTREGVVKGKVRYMAPEQVHGRAIDRRADVWSMGVCLYELVTGELPFDGDDVDVVRRLMSEEAPPRPTGAVPEAVDLVLSRSLVRMRDARFASAASMHRAVEEAIDDIGVPATNDDVAEFVRSAVPELEVKRRDTVNRALAGAKSRGKDVPVPPLAADSVKNLEEAFAPTVLSGPKPPVKPARRALVLATPREESKPTLRASELVAEPPARRGGIVWAMLVLAGLGAGAWFGWPGEARIRAFVTPSPPVTPRVDVPPPAPPAPSEDLTAAAVPSGDPLGATVDAAPDGAPHHAATDGHHHGHPAVPLATGAPAASGWGPVPPTVPAASASDASEDNNPYN